MKSYRIKFKGMQSAWLRLDYEDNGTLQNIALTDGHEMSDEQLNFVWCSLPFYLRLENKMLTFFHQERQRLEQRFRVDELPTDVSFDIFWTTYGNKVGKKERSQQLWKLLPDTSKILALAGIKKYKNWLLQNTSVQMLYPETYISQKRWENEY